MYKRIMVLLDSSKSGGYALLYAKRLAAKFMADLHLLYLRDSGNKTGKITSMSAGDTKMATHSENTDGRPITVKEREIKVQTVELADYSAKKIAAHANSKKIDLIVTAQSESGTKQFDMTNLVEKLLNLLEQPILIVKPGEKIKDDDIFGKILVPLDITPEGEIILRDVEQLACNMKSEVILFNVIPVNFDSLAVAVTAYLSYQEKKMKDSATISKYYLEEVANKLREKSIAVRCQVESGLVINEILDYADQIKADLIAISTQGHSKIGKWIFGSTTSKVIRKAKTNLLLIKQRK